MSDNTQLNTDGRDFILDYPEEYRALIGGLMGQIDRDFQAFVVSLVM